MRPLLPQPSFTLIAPETLLGVCCTLYYWNMSFPIREQEVTAATSWGARGEWYISPVSVLVVYEVVYLEY